MSGIINSAGSKSGVIGTTELDFDDIGTQSSITTGQNIIIGKLRIQMGYVQMDNSSSSLENGFYYNGGSVSYSGFASPPRVFMSVRSYFHDTFFAGISDPSTTDCGFRLSAGRQGGVLSANYVHWIAIGESS